MEIMGPSYYNILPSLVGVCLMHWFTLQDKQMQSKGLLCWHDMTVIARNEIKSPLTDMTRAARDWTIEQ